MTPHGEMIGMQQQAWFFTIRRKIDMLVNKFRYSAIMFIKDRWTYMLLIKAILNVYFVPIIVPKNSKNYNWKLLKKILLEYAI